MPIRPATFPSTSRMEAVLPSSFITSTRLARSGGSFVRSPAALGEPRNSSMPLSRPFTPLPPIAEPPSAPLTSIFSSAALARMASARGWLEPASRDAASARTSASERPTATMSVTFGLPAVSVPVLSIAATVILPTVSRTAPPFMSRPRRAPAESAEAMAAGVDMTRAHGHPISRTARPL